jgi:hypothetical protein
MSDTVREPDIRVRINHKWTQKGWRCDETTVEVSTSVSGASGGDTRALIQGLMYAAHQDGLDEANRRNAQEEREHGV